jgi:SAM-dependent methyltransferase
VDVGSGTGSYQPRRRTVIAVEPSRTMIAQRSPDAAPVLEGVAESLPFPNGRFDAALAVLTIHHWADHVAGLRELTRVASRQVILTWEPERFVRFWLVEEYLPEIAANEAQLPALDAVTDVLAVASVLSVPVPADCTDGFCGAYWRRPAAYLDPNARHAISAFSHCDPMVVVQAMARLRSDLVTGRWAQRHRRLLDLGELDLGYRLVIANGLASAAAT